VTRLRLINDGQLSAGLYTVKLQQLHPEASVATLEALAALHHLRSLDLP
jgi:hypothetical protein